LGGALFGYRYIRTTEAVGAAYEIVEHEIFTRSETCFCR
jgi:hypothetical protein